VGSVADEKLIARHTSMLIGLLATDALRAEEAQLEAGLEAH
jgi:hypothetical protein